ncbi:alkaline phosphatase family protein [Plantibacter sp. YIM 135347]|uniref:alkaline phosphatase family protein n=1 Tax=Plantibacter sp. YIM 135347 TaxID=3423919 RepID=UPI003D340A77
MSRGPFTHPVSRRTVLAGGAALAVSATAVGIGAAPAFGSPATDDSRNRVRKSIIIGTDGCVFARVQDGHTPNLDRLIANGMLATSNLGALPLAPTVSGPGWSSIATGAWPDKHGVIDNTFEGSRFTAYPEYLTRLKAADPERSTLVVASWDPVAINIFGPAVDERIGSPGDAATVATVSDRLANGDPDAIMVHLDEPDIAGHDYGAASTEYLAAIEHIDVQIGQLLTAVEARATYADEDWLIVVTTDHGHTPAGGHGGNSIGERGVFVVATGGGITPGSRLHDVKLVDIAPAILRHHGVTVEADWDLDGAAFDRLPDDDFDQLRTVLLPAVDESAPADRLGWTHDAPEGWSIDNSRMPAGGTTEWRGWAFTTDEFWTNVDLGQGRETSVRNRDVFAVADSDEWDDVAHDAGPFDSTLHTPAYPLNGADEATLSFATNHQADPTQSASVSASFDGADPIELVSYTTSVNRVERLALPVPRGAASVRFGFRYIGSNGSFWTVDQIALAQPGTEPVVTPPVVEEGDEVPAGMLPATGASPAAGAIFAAATLGLGALGALAAFRSRGARSSD